MAIYIHLGTLLFLFIVILLADKQAFSWIRGKRETLSKKTLNLFHTLVWLGLIAMIATGVYMALPLKDFLVASPAFYVKMLFVLALIVNSFFIGKFMTVASERSFASLSPKEKLPVLISGGVSTVSWIGAFIAALFMSTSQWLVFLFSQIF